MKYTIINGCENNIYDGIKEKSEERASTQWIDLSRREISHCRGCDYCQTINPGLCAIKDGQNEILQEFMISDVAILVTPIRWGCCDARLKNFIDRTEPLCLPFQIQKGKSTIMKGRYAKYPKLIVCGILENPDTEEETLFREFILGSNLAQICEAAEVKTFTKENELVDYIGKMVS